MAPIWKTRHLLLPCLHMKLESQLPEWKYRNKNSRTLSLLLAPMLNYYFISVKPGSVFCFKCQPITLNELKTLCLSEISKMTGRRRGCSATTDPKIHGSCLGKNSIPSALMCQVFPLDLFRSRAREQKRHLSPVDRSFRRLTVVVWSSDTDQPCLREWFLPVSQREVDEEKSYRWPTKDSKTSLFV